MILQHLRILWIVLYLLLYIREFVIFVQKPQRYDKSHEFCEENIFLKQQSPGTSRNLTKYLAEKVNNNQLFNGNYGDDLYP